MGCQIIQCGNSFTKLPKSIFRSEPISRTSYSRTERWDYSVFQQRNEIIQLFILSMLESCDRDILKDVFTIAHFHAEELVIDLDDKGLNKMILAMEQAGCFAMSPTLFDRGKAILLNEDPRRYLLEKYSDRYYGNTWNGVPVFSHPLFKDSPDKLDLIYGTWNKIWISLRSGIEIQINPYTYQESGEVEVTVSRLANLGAHRNATFIKSNHF